MFASLDPILIDLVLLFGLCVAVGVVFHRLRIPPVVGFLFAGALVGPNAFGFVAHRELVDQLAEVGVVVLLFSVGLELSVHTLARMRRAILAGGSVQIVATTALGAAVALAGGSPLGSAVFLGFCLSLSSTAAVTRLLVSRGGIGSPAGRFAVGVCIAQDLAVVPMMLLLPLLGHAAAGTDGGAGTATTALLRTAESFGLLALTVGVAWLLVPTILDMVSRVRSRELFVLTLIGLCLGIAIVTAQLGLSLALGAFLAGAVLAGSDYQHHAVSEIEPLRDAFSSLFFVSIGMLFDPKVIVESPLLVLLALGAVLVGKTLLVVLAGRASGLPPWIALRAGLMIAQVGEFSFVLVQAGKGYALLEGRWEAIFVAVAVLSIATTPLLFWLGQFVGPRRGGEVEKPRGGSAQLRNHVILVGFGLGGRTTGRALERLGIDYVAIEMNAATVKEEKAKGVRIFVGDATREIVLRAAGIERARLLVLALNDAEATRRAVALARGLAPGVEIVARALYVSEVLPLQRLGAQEIVPQELETTVEILVRVLRRYLVPDDEVQREVDKVREEAHGLPKAAQPAPAASRPLAELVPNLGVELLRVGPGSPVANQTLAESSFRKVTGCSIAAVQRGKDVIVNVDGDTRLETGDAALVVGPRIQLDQIALMFRDASDGRAGVVPRQ